MHIARIPLLILLIAVFIGNSVEAQQFKGTVVDNTTDQPIAFANVFFVELETGTITDSNGMFIIAHPPHRSIHIRISFIGYITIFEKIDLDNALEKVFYLEPTHIELEEIVVSVPMGKLQDENVVLVDRKKLGQLATSSSLTLSEAISDIPGVEQNTTGAGIGKPVIRGLSGNRIVTYSQGVRIENQQWGAEHGLGVGQVGIESVEVIKGPASLLYGSDALGGVFYFVDERYANHNTVGGFFSTRFMSNTLGTMNNLGIKLHKENIKLSLFGNFTSNADYQIPGSVRVFNTRFDEQNFKTFLGFNKNKWIANIRYSFLRNNFGIADSALYLSDTDRQFVLPFQTIDNHILSFESTFITGASNLKLILGFTDNKRQEFEDNTSLAALEMKLKTYTYDVKWHSPAFENSLSFIVGVQGMYQTNENSGEEILIPDATTSDLGILAIANYNLRGVQLQAGIRGDTRLIDTDGIMDPDDAVPPVHKTYSSLNYSVGGVYDFGKTKLRANISSGFRAPNTSELLSHGVHEGTNRYEKGNPDLQSENATQIDLTIDYHDDHFSFSINPFYNAIQNYIFLSPTDSIIDNSPVFAYLQTNAALFGGEAGVHYHPHAIHWLHIESNLSTIFAEDQDNIPLPLIPATKINTSLKVEFSQKSKVKIKEAFIQHIYRFSQNRVSGAEAPSADYHLINLGVQFEISTNDAPIEIHTGVSNLLNTEYIDHLSRFKSLTIPNPGINFYVGLKVAFSTKLKERR
ncbi:MAG: TonB-dependent receptor [Bacteroidetes bacterium]|nr:MAG: TonB-dependent receptor [Bacteroidota bacterium]